MIQSGRFQSCAYEIEEGEAGAFALRLKGSVGVENAGAAIRALGPEVKALAKKPRARSLDLDISGLDRMDDFGALALSRIREMAGLAKTGGDIPGASVFSEMIDSFDRAEENQKTRRAAAPKSPGALEGMGASFLNSLSEGKRMVSFLGETALAFLYALRHPGSFRFRDMALCMEETGVKALPVIALSSFLLGLIMAFMSSLQLRQFGADLHVASLVALAMVSELGPVMTAILVAGRTGSAFAAEIGAMKISEEIDALFSMGFNPVLFLALPRIMASVIVVPILTLFANLFAILGGLLIGVVMLNLTPGSYMAQTVEVLDIFEFAWGALKSVVFALAVSWVGCLRGFQTQGSAGAVGAAATSAVVTCVFLVIFFDSVFALIRYYCF